MASTRTPLFFRKTPGGVHSIVNESVLTGEIFFVDSGAASAADNTARGSSPDAPFATIDFAVGQCKANNGDHIFVMPGHAETISAAADLALDVAGITIKGLGTGSSRPTITLDTIDSADVDVDAANITVENVIFSANIDDIVAAIDVNADDFTLRNCTFQATAGGFSFLICVLDAAATASDRITIEGCTSYLLDAADTHFVNFAGTGDGHVIQDNLLHGNWGTMCIGGAGVVTRCSILRNMIFNIATDADACINMAATATGICAGNMCAGGHATDGIVPGDLGSLENYYELSTSDLSGILEPAVT